MIDTPVTYINGMVTWVCRHCGHVNRIRFNRGRWKHECSNPPCGRATAWVQTDVPISCTSATRAQFYQWYQQQTLAQSR